MTEREIFLAMLDLPDQAARSQYLDEVCGGSPAMRARVESLLLSHDTAASFLGRPAVQPPEPNVLATLEGGSVATPTDPHAADTDLTFLDKPGRPGSLGRLGHYEVLEVLGRGGFGIVFRAFDDTLQRVVAVKVLAPQLAATSPARKRFLREARSSAKVRHEHVVQVYEVGEQPLPYLVMEFIPGETLQERLDRTGPLDVPEVLRIGQQIAEGLAAAHASDLIHRDIKPGNILLEGGQNRVKITDFGLARAADDASISQSGVIAGTPLFMAPEQALGHKLDQRADLFSFGSVLYQMVSGRPPFRASSALAVLKRVAEETPRPIPEIIPEAPAWLCDIIAKLHAKNPDDRFQSAREIADVLADCEAQLTAHARVKNFSRIPRGKPQRSRRWKWAVAAAVLLLLVLALALTETAGVTHLFGNRSTPTEPHKPDSNAKPPSEAKPKVAVPPPAPTIHDTWLKAVALLPLDQQVEVVAARMKERLPDFEGAFLKAIPAMSAERQVVLVDVWLKERKPAFAGFEDAWLQAIPATPADRRVVLVEAWLRECNPGFADSVTHKIEDGVVTNLEVPLPIVQDLTPLRALTGLRTLTCRSTAGYDNQATRDAAVLRSLGALEKINGKPVAQFWKEALARQAEFKQWLQLVPALTAEQQAAAVAAKLKERNPGLSDEVGHKSEDGVVTEISLGGNVTDLSPVRALPGLQAFRLRHSRDVSDFSPLSGMKHLTVLELHLCHQVRDAGLAHFKDRKNLTHLDLTHAKQVTDAGLANFKGCKNLTYLRLDWTQVTDAGLASFEDCKNLTDVMLAATQVSDAGVAHLRDCKDLTYLNLAQTQVTEVGLAHLKDCKNLKELVLLEASKVADLSPIKDLKLTRLNCVATGVTDLSPLEGMPLEDIRLTPKNITQGLNILREMKGLTIGINLDQRWPAAEFWDRYDKGEFK